MTRLRRAVDCHDIHHLMVLEGDQITCNCGPIPADDIDHQIMAGLADPTPTPDPTRPSIVLTADEQDLISNALAASEAAQEAADRTIRTLLAHGNTLAAAMADVLAGTAGPGEWLAAEQALAAWRHLTRTDRETNR